jgi:uncharacterized protein YndB with AHSA1/START domain
MDPRALEQHPQLRITRRYPVAAEKVWRAWTDPQALSGWFGPVGVVSVEAEMDLRPQGRYSIRFRTADGQQHGVSGVYETVDRPHRLVFGWAWQSTPERVSRVSLTLREADGGTELELVHDRFFDAVAAGNHERGWTATMRKFDAWMAAQPA